MYKPREYNRSSDTGTNPPPPRAKKQETAKISYDYGNSTQGASRGSKDKKTSDSPWMPGTLWKKGTGRPLAAGATGFSSESSKKFIPSQVMLSGQVHTDGGHSGKENTGEVFQGKWNNNGSESTEDTGEAFQGRWQ